jgi:hypothetical protein
VPDGYRVDSESASVVLLGNFNPAIVNPWWMVHHNLLSEDAVEDVEELVTLPRLSVFQADWLRSEVTDNRMQFSTVDPLAYSRLKDLALAVLHLLPELPLGAMGLNRTFQIEMESDQAWHRVGDRLVPKKFWNDLVNLPGTRSLLIEGARTDEYAGNIRIRMEPSVTVKFGVFVEHNDHYVLKEAEHPINSRDDMLNPNLVEDLSVAPSPENVIVARRILTERWHSSLAEAEAAAMRIASVGVR